MSKKHDLRKQRTGTIINVTSKKQEQDNRERLRIETEKTKEQA
jgi:hypothetical protein